MIQPRRQILMAVPVHTQAGVNNPRLGFLNVISEAVGGIVGGLFGSKSKSDELRNQRKMAQDQLAATERLAAQQIAFGEKQIDAALQTERIRAQNEIAAIDSALAAQLQSQRVKERVAQEALSTQLVAQTQAGIFDLSKSGLEQSSSLARAYPKAASATLVLLVLGTAAAITVMARPSSRSRRRRGGRRRGSLAYSPSPSVSLSPTAGVSS